MRCVVTGSTGVLGSHIAYRLAREGHEVVLLGRGPDFANRAWAAVSRWGQVLPRACLRFVKWDLLSPFSPPTEMGGVDRIIHAAADTCLAQGADVDGSHINLRTTTNVLNLAHTLQVGRFDFISSAYVGGSCQDESLECIHTTPPPSRNPYERSKWLCEQEVVRGLGLGFSSVVIHRPSLILPPLEQVPFAGPRSLTQLWGKLSISTDRWRNREIRVNLNPNGCLGFVHLTDLGTDLSQIVGTELTDGCRVFHYSRKGGPTNGDLLEWTERQFPGLKVVLGEQCRIGRKIVGDLAPYLLDRFLFDQTRLTSALGRPATSEGPLDESYFIPFMRAAGAIPAGQQAA